MITLFILKSNARGMRYGMGTYLRQLTDYLIENKKDLEIFLVNYLTDIHKELTIKNISKRLTEIYIPLTVANFKSEDQSKKYANMVVSFLIPFITRSQNPIFQVNYPDALHIVKILKLKFRIAVISIIHSAQWQFAFNGNRKKFLEMWTSMKNKKESNDITMKSIEYERELYELSDKIVSITKYMKEFIMNYYQIPDYKIEIIQNGINISIPNNTKLNEKERIKQDLGFSRSEKLILFSGRLDKGKGLFFLLEVFSEVVKHFKNLRLVVVGDDSGPDKITKYLSKCNSIWGKVTFTGFVENDYMTKFYKIADIGIIPSIYDQCPYVALEMMQYRIPLVVSDIEGLNEILTGGECLFLKPLIDDEGNISFSKIEAVNAIIFLLRNLKSFKKGITSSYTELLRNRYSSVIMGERIYSVFRNLTKKQQAHQLI